MTSYIIYYHQDVFVCVCVWIITIFIFIYHKWIVNQLFHTTFHFSAQTNAFLVETYIVIFMVDITLLQIAFSIAIFQ